jgi:hypothetical protein
MAEVEKDMTNLLVNTSIDAKSNNGKFSIQDYAITFVYGMGKSQRERFKQMLEQGIKCGESVAISYGVDYDQLMNEVKRILNVED